MLYPVHLRAQAERCFRLASGPAGSRLADEPEALGRVFEREARKAERVAHRPSEPHAQNWLLDDY
jgi:hypothetical protein